MQESSSENQLQSADGSEERCTKISERQLNFLLESRQAVKNKT